MIEPRFGEFENDNRYHLEIASKKISRRCFTKAQKDAVSKRVQKSLNQTTQDTASANNRATLALKNIEEQKIFGQGMVKYLSQQADVTLNHFFVNA